MKFKVIYPDDEGALYYKSLREILCHQFDEEAETLDLFKFENFGYTSIYEGREYYFCVRGNNHNRLNQNMWYYTDTNGDIQFAPPTNHLEEQTFDYPTLSHYCDIEKIDKILLAYNRQEKLDNIISEL